MFLVVQSFLGVMTCKDPFYCKDSYKECFTNAQLDRPLKFLIGAMSDPGILSARTSTLTEYGNHLAFRIMLISAKTMIPWQTRRR